MVGAWGRTRLRSLRGVPRLPPRLPQVAGLVARAAILVGPVRPPQATSLVIAPPVARTTAALGLATQVIPPLVSAGALLVSVAAVGAPPTLDAPMVVLAVRDTTEAAQIRAVPPRRGIEAHPDLHEAVVTPLATASPCLRRPLRRPPPRVLAIQGRESGTRLALRTPDAPRQARRGARGSTSTPRTTTPSGTARSGVGSSTPRVEFTVTVAPRRRETTPRRRGGPRSSIRSGTPRASRLRTRFQETPVRALRPTEEVRQTSQD